MLDYWLRTRDETIRGTPETKYVNGYIVPARTGMVCGQGTEEREKKHQAGDEDIHGPLEGQVKAVVAPG